MVRVWNNHIIWSLVQSTVLVKAVAARKDPDKAQRDKDMQKNWELLAKYLKGIQTTKNNLRTSSNSRNKTEDTTPKGNYRKSGSATEWDKQCFNCKRFWPNAKECRKPKRVKGLLYPQGKDDDVANNFMAKDSGGSYIEGISSNEKPIGTDLEVAFRKSTCFVRDLQETICLTANKFFSNLSDGCETAVLNGPLKRRFMLVSKMDPFSDADHADALLLAKATSGGYSSLGDKLVSWMSKNKNCNALYSTRTSNSVIASYAQYVVENGIIELYFVRTEYQLADMFTKALPEDRFKYLVRRIGMRCLTPADLEV
ncbi:hypothetical protein Tco_0167361 [Tanacetum coccineum]